MTADDLQALAADLAHPDPTRRVAALGTLRATPIADRRVLALLEARLSDDAVAMVSQPARIGEVGGLAVEALAATRRALGLPAEQAVRSRPTCTATELEALGRARGLPTSADPIEAFTQLRAAGALPPRERRV